MGVYHRGATTQRDDDSADESGPFNPEESAMGFVWFILVGLVAGLLAGVIMKGSGYGMLGDIVVGVLGGLLGGGLVQALGIPLITFSTMRTNEKGSPKLLAGRSGQRSLSNTRGLP
jgi:uncharacterized membrane protein YeaQ/YmgE (transglycosylase-associated protein family)